MKTFHEIWNTCKTSHLLMADDRPGNGTGYFDPLMAMFAWLPEGKIIRTECPETNRKIIIVGHANEQKQAASVIFQRYADNMDVIVGNVNDQVQSFMSIGGKKLYLEDIEEVLNFRWAMLKDHAMIDRMAQEKLAMMANGGVELHYNDIFWAEEYCPEYVDLLKNEYNHQMAIRFPKKAV